MKVESIILEGEFVRLEPMKPEHLNALCEVGMTDSIWFFTANVMHTVEDMQRYIATAMDDAERKIALPFVTIDKKQNKIVGSTRFGNIDTKNRKTEIGWTWINPLWQRSYVNTEAKFLMLKHAFETWNCARVELKTDVLNEKSRNAILGIGAKQEGILRRHLITETGRFRDTVYFSIIDDEWQDVKENLRAKLSFKQ